MELFRDIFKFFIDSSKSLTSRFIIIGMFVGLIFLVDNYLGFSFYYGNGRKIEQLKSIYDIKKQSDVQETLILELDKIEKNILGRQNVVEIFGDLFSSEYFDIDQANSDQNLNVVESDSSQAGMELDSIYTDEDIVKEEITKTQASTLPKNSRSRIWHTISSSFGLIIIFLIVPFVPFTQPPFEWSTFLGVMILCIPLSGLIWLNQYLLGLIPVILNQPWINYILNFIIHFGILSWLASSSKKN